MNQLLNTLPKFSSIQAGTIVSELKQLLEDNLKTIAELLKNKDAFHYDDLVEPLEDLDDRLNHFWSPIGHVNSVANSDELRQAYNACMPLLSEYSTEIGQNEALYLAYRKIAESPEFARLSKAQRKIVDNALRDFRLSGVALPVDKKNRFKEIAQALASLNSQFQDNLLDATQAFKKHILDEAQLSGIPDSARAIARQLAESEGQEGWIFTLEFPSYFAVTCYADDRELRREFYWAYTTRASDQGPDAKKFDNSEVMEKILALRHEEANLLGFSDYAELSIETKMAASTQAVEGFLEDLCQRAKPFADKDLTDLKAFAKQSGIDALQAWDVAYFSEKLRQHDFSLSEEEIKVYFPDKQVIQGMFAVVEKLFGLKINELNGVDTWHEDVRFYEIKDSADSLRGGFYLDLYARAKKRGGAWMDECITRRKRSEQIQYPVAFLNCNFTPPAGNDPALLRHDEVLTLFHEFGHGLHHLLTQVDQLGVSGIRGVEWDAVELPSQFLENFCWEKQALDLISGHYQTHEPLPQSLFDKMIAARNFQSGMQLVRQVEYSLFDFRIHRQYQPDLGGRIYEILEKTRQQCAVLFPPEFNRFPHSFSHIFAGGYAAGYYSYKWAEVLSSDAFSLFEENGIFDTETGKAFLEKILEKGGSHDAAELFVAFRGREPEIDALLRHNGIA